MYMDLKKKLKLFSEKKQSDQIIQTEQIIQTDQTIIESDNAGHDKPLVPAISHDKPPVPSKSHLEVSSLLQGKEINTPEGSCLIIENRYPLSYIYGGCSLGDIIGDFMDIDNNKKSSKAQALSTGLHRVFSSYLSAGDIDEFNNMTPFDFVFLDTETTGLSTGAGTVAFLVGFGYFEQDYFVLKQIFMRDYDEEPALLHILMKETSHFKALVSFNGKGYDVNLLSGRYAFYRMKSNICSMIQLDLMYPARRVWKLALSNCKLKTIEEAALSEVRIGDVDGAMIPGIYFKYLESRDGCDIVNVIKHNELDILSIVALLYKLMIMLNNPVGAGYLPAEVYGMGTMLESHRDLITSKQCYTESGESITAALLRLAAVYKKSGYIENAVQIWEGMLNEDTAKTEVYIQLAKYYEHIKKDFVSAINMTESASLLSRKFNISHGDMNVQKLSNRLERLKRKKNS